MCEEGSPYFLADGKAVKVSADGVDSYGLCDAHDRALAKPSVAVDITSTAD